MKRRYIFVVALVSLLFTILALSSVPVSAQGNGLWGRYWKDTFFGAYLPPYDGCYAYNMPIPGPYPTPEITRIDPNIDFTNPGPKGWNWRPFTADPNEHEFSVKWTGYIIIPSTGTYEFRLVSDDGSWLFIDKSLVINHGGVHGPWNLDGSIYLTQGSHEIVVDFYQTCDSQSGIVLSWKVPGADWAVVPSSVLIPEILSNPSNSVPEFGLELPVVISLAAPVLSIIKRRRLKTK